MIFKVIINNFDSGLNELLNHQEKRYDYRTKKMRVYNTEKVKNEKLIRNCLMKQGMSKVRFEHPIAIHYMVYAKDKRRDRGNVFAAIDKCFCDALQTMKILPNDAWDWVVKLSFDSAIDRKNPRVEITITELD